MSCGFQVGAEIWICLVPTWLLAAELRESYCQEELTSTIWLAQGLMAPSKQPRAVDHRNGWMLWCGPCSIRSITGEKSLEHFSAAQVHLEFCLALPTVSQSLVFIPTLSVLRRETLRSISYLKWDRISGIPEAQRSGEGMEKEVLRLVLLCAVRQTLKKLSCPDFSNCCDPQTFFLIIFFFWTVCLLQALDRSTYEMRGETFQARHPPS